MNKDKHYWVRFMRSKPFKIKRNHEKGRLPWIAVREVERDGVRLASTSSHKSLSEAKEFVALMRYAERTGRRLSTLHPPDFKSRMHDDVDCDWYPRQKRSSDVR